MRVLTRHLALVAGIGAFATAGACGDDKETTKDTTTATDAATDSGTDSTATDAATDAATETAEEVTTTTDATLGDTETVATTYATATFSIDDRADMTYDSTDGLAWKGSFSYDSATNVLNFNGSWGGPFVPLYDDGPAPSGHEAPGATAGDHIWTVVVKIPTPEAAQEFEYGAIRGSVAGADGQWIWVGTNGKFTVPAGSTAQVDAAGLVIPKSGDIDLKLTIDVSGDGANLAADFQGVAYTDVKVKGSAWGWTEVALVDDGTKGDATAGDKKYTFTFSENLGKHDGLLKVGDKPEFVFVLGGVEYKMAGAADATGVKASLSADGTTFVDAAIMLLDANKNTYVDVPFFQPAGTVPVSFMIDDTAGMTYDATDGLAWKGSFKYDPATRILAKDGSWGGPFPMLYDDGPWNAGGHEPAGSTAGDHKWGITVFVSNTAAETFEYGAIRGSVNGADGEWIWVGTNGGFAVTAGQTDAIAAAGLTIPAGGTIDFRLVIDVSGDGANLSADFQGVAYTDVKVKGSAWAWKEIALVDDGTKGDATSGDKKYTFTLKDNLGKHDGLLRSGDKPEFVFVLGGVEYKAAGAASSTGVTAFIAADGTTFTATTIAVLEANKNTYVSVP